MQSSPLNDRHRSTTEILESLVDRIHARTDKPQFPFGVPSVDRLIWGFQKQELTIIGAETSHGKSAFTLFGAWNLAKLGIPVVFLTLEMAEEGVVERIACMELGLNGWKLRTGDAQEKIAFENSLMKLRGRLNLAPFEIIGYSGRNLSQIEDVLKKFKPEFLFVDHAQKTSPIGYGNKYEALSDLAHRLQDFSKQYKCGVILSSQINRGGEFLKGSGDLEESAQNLIYLNWKCRSDASETDQHLFEVTVKKQTMGPCDHVDINFYPANYTFTDRDPYSPKTKDWMDK